MENRKIRINRILRPDEPVEMLIDGANVYRQPRCNWEIISKVLIGAAAGLAIIGVAIMLWWSQ
jgi:hypothetical protein